jgi:hypothetical protein
MWQLRMTNAAKEWIEVGNFDSVTAASCRICDIEGLTVTRAVCF